MWLYGKKSVAYTTIFGGLILAPFPSEVQEGGGWFLTLTHRSPGDVKINTVKLEFW